MHLVLNAEAHRTHLSARALRWGGGRGQPSTGDTKARNN